MKTFQNLEDIPFEYNDSGVGWYSMPNEVCSISYVFFPAGYTGPEHNHTAQTVKIILKGELAINGEQVITTGANYICDGGDPYYVKAKKDSVLALIETPGTEMVTAE